MKQLLLLIFGVVMLTTGCRSQVIAVNLANTGTQEARNLEVRYPGGSFGVASLPAGKTYQYRIKPFFNGQMEFDGLYGTAKHERVVGPKVEKDQSGEIRIDLNESGIRWTPPVR